MLYWICCCSLIQLGVNHHTAAHSLLSARRERIGKKAKTCALREGQCSRTEKNMKIIQVMKEYTKQVMHNTISHHLLTNVQAAPKSWPISTSFFFLFRTMTYDVEYPFGQWGSTVLAVSPPIFLCPPPSLLAGQCEKLKNPCLRVSTAQCQREQQCVINIILFLYPKHSTVPDTRRKINFIPWESRKLDT